MLKLYKNESNQTLSYAEYWITNETAVIHTGKAGKIGTIEEVPVSDASEFENSFIKKYSAEGYYKIPEQECFWIVVQFPVKSLTGNKRDSWLKDKVCEVLDEELGWKGLGHVDGFDIGLTMNPKKQFALNIYCIAVDEVLGIAAIKRALREYRLDYTKVKIASRKNTEDSQYALKYSAKKTDLEFYL